MSESRTSQFSTGGTEKETEPPTNWGEKQNDSGEIKYLDIIKWKKKKFKLFTSMFSFPCCTAEKCKWFIVIFLLTWNFKIKQRKTMQTPELRDRIDHDDLWEYQYWLYPINLILLETRAIFSSVLVDPGLASLQF